MILLDCSFDLGKDEVLFVKIGVRALDFQLYTSFGLKFNFQTPDPKVEGFFEIS